MEGWGEGEARPQGMEGWGEEGVGMLDHREWRGGGRREARPQGMEG